MKSSENFIIYDVAGKILRTGFCPPSMVEAQAHKDEFVMLGNADDSIQKIVDGQVVDKTPAEINRDNPEPTELPDSDRPANITKGQLKDILDRLSTVEHLGK